MILSGSWGEYFMGQSAQEESVKEKLHPSPHGAHECCLQLESEISPYRWRQKFSDLKTVENEDWILARGRWGSDTPLSYCKSIRSLNLWFFNSLIAMFHVHLTSPLQKKRPLSYLQNSLWTLQIKYWGFPAQANAESRDGSGIPPG